MKVRRLVLSYWEEFDDRGGPVGGDLWEPPLRGETLQGWDVYGEWGPRPEKRFPRPCAGDVVTCTEGRLVRDGTPDSSAREGLSTVEGLEQYAGRLRAGLSHSLGGRTAQGKDKTSVGESGHWRGRVTTGESGHWRGHVASAPRWVGSEEGLRR